MSMLKVMQFAMGATLIAIFVAMLMLASSCSTPMPSPDDSYLWRTL